MSKLTVGLLTGAVLASAAAVTALAVSGTGSAGHSGTVAAAATTTATATGSVRAGTQPAADSNAGRLASAASPSASASAPAGAAAKAPKPAEVNAIRSVQLQLPTTPSDVGTNVTGSIQVMDTAGQVVTPVANVAVALQQKRGTAFVTVADGVTGDDGTFAVAFTSKVNSTWRAQLTPTTGMAKFSAPVTTTASANVNWASRPNLDVVHGAANSYSFRVASATGGTAHLEIANSKTPTKWAPLAGVVVPGTGVVQQSERFPTAGTWLLRGATGLTATNGAGYTTILTVNVS